METDSETRRKIKAPKRFDWTDDAFLADASYYTGLRDDHLWPGIGRLVGNMQSLRENLVLCQELVSDETPDCPRAYNVGKLDRVPPAYRLRDSALGEVFGIRYGGWEHGVEVEISKLRYLVSERNFFVDRFFVSGDRDGDAMNDALLRLKRAVTLSGNMAGRYGAFAEERKV